MMEGLGKELALNLAERPVMRRKHRARGFGYFRVTGDCKGLQGGGRVAQTVNGKGLEVIEVISHS